MPIRSQSFRSVSSQVAVGTGSRGILGAAQNSMAGVAIPAMSERKKFLVCSIQTIIRNQKAESKRKGTLTSPTATLRASWLNFLHPAHLIENCGSKVAASRFDRLPVVPARVEVLVLAKFDFFQVIGQRVGKLYLQLL